PPGLLLPRLGVDNQNRSQKEPSAVSGATAIPTTLTWPSTIPQKTCTLRVCRSCRWFCCGSVVRAHRVPVCARAWSAALGSLLILACGLTGWCASIRVGRARLLPQGVLWRWLRRVG